MAKKLINFKDIMGRLIAVSFSILASYVLQGLVIELVCYGIYLWLNHYRLLIRQKVIF